MKRRAFLTTSDEARVTEANGSESSRTTAMALSPCTNSSSPDNHGAHDYTERIRERLPARLQELLEAAGMSIYALAKRVGVSLEVVWRIKGGESMLTLHVANERKSR